MIAFLLHGVITCARRRPVLAADMGGRPSGAISSARVSAMAFEECATKNGGVALVGCVEAVWWY